MANYERIVQLRPETADFIRNRRLITFRGDVLSYRANARCDSFSTDAAGFRHTSFGGKDLSLAECVRSGRYGIVLGASNLFGFGIAGNGNCMASLLSDRFGFPFANAAMPGGNSRNLHSLLLGLLVGSGHAPAVVVHSNGGDLANFCESSVADPVFGSPNRSELKAIRDAGIRPDADRTFPRLLAFTSLWTSAIAKLCRANGAGMVLIHQSTFFEKTKPTKFERDCGLGQAVHASQEGQFANHRKFNEPFYAKRKLIAESLGIPLAAASSTDEITFIDEFHCDEGGMRLMSDAVAAKIEPLLAGEAAAEPPS
jgi:hypothetical protein